VNIKGYGAEDSYTYTGSGVLKNKFDIYDGDELDKRERLFFLKRSESVPETINTTPESFLALHQHLFQDVYEWAGQIRTVSLFKGNTPFCRSEHIKKHLSDHLKALADDENLMSHNTRIAAKSFAKYTIELNMVHAFREGNGRHLRVFLSIYVRQLGHKLDFKLVRANDWINACIEGVTRGSEQMAGVLYKAMTREPSNGSNANRSRNTDS